MHSSDMRTKSRQVAYGGLFAALSVILMLSAAVLPIATFAAPMAAGIALMPVAAELGDRTAVICYIAVSLLAVFTVADSEAVAMFVSFFGYYPFLRRKIMSVKKRPLRIAIKLLLFNAAVCGAYLLMIFVFSLSAVAEGMTAAYWLVLLAAGNLLMLCYDRLLTVLSVLYFRRLRPLLFRGA